jgi:hypothetical protein
MHKYDYVEEEKERYFVFVAGTRQPKKKHKTLESAEIEAIKLTAMLGKPTWVCRLVSVFSIKPEKPLEVKE